MLTQTPLEFVKNVEVPYTYNVGVPSIQVKLNLCATHMTTH